MTPPIDHLPASVRDRDCIRRDQEIERRKGLFRQARKVSKALATITDRQRSGDLTRADGAVLAHMILANLRACVRRERFYRPTRAGIAKETGYAPRTVTQSLGRLKRLGIVVVARYEKGGRIGDKGKGLSTEFRSGCLQFICDQLTGLGYRLPKSLREDLVDLGKWAAGQVGETTETRSDKRPSRAPTWHNVPTTFGTLGRATPSRQPLSPLAMACLPCPPPGESGQPITYSRDGGTTMAAWPYSTARWKKLRLAKLDAEPLCEVCEKRGGFPSPADTVDHIRPIRQGGDPFPPLDGLMALCARCHSEKTASYDRTRGNVSNRRFKGCAPDGSPVDPGDGWYGG